MFIETPANKNSLANRTLLFGVGINDAPYKTHYIDSNGKKTRCPYYVAWSNMLKRCYCKKSLENNKTYALCFVDEEWHTFSTFKKWMSTQDWKGKYLDKDILERGNKIYSKKSCIFITNKVNTFLAYDLKTRGAYPQGVCFHNQVNKFISRCKVDGVWRSLGCYKTPEEASAAYKQFKSKHILEVAEEYKNEPRLYEALKNHSRMMLL